VSTVRFLGMLFLSVCLRAQNYPAPWNANPAPRPFDSPLLTASGEAPVMGSFPDLPPSRQPIAGVVSLRDLENPIPRKALREAYAAQKLAQANKTAESIARFEKALRIYPRFRDARVDLGIEYARAGRLAEAREQLQKALDIGPPVSTIYYDLALASLASKDNREAERAARKALELAPGHQGAKDILEYTLTH
jgi:tetratricopeptide (TPR) repeat protein